MDTGDTDSRALESANYLDGQLPSTWSKTVGKWGLALLFLWKVSDWRCPKSPRLSVSIPGGSAVDTFGGAGFGYDDFGQERQLGLEPVPNPDGDVFAGGVFQTPDLVEVVMVQFCPNWFNSVGNVGIINDPAQLRIA